MVQEKEEWISIHALAHRLGCTTQTIRNRIKRGAYDVKPYQRGQHVAYLVLAPKNK